MMQNERTKRRTLGWWISSVAIGMIGAGCSARSQDQFDSQSHWLKCTEQNQCGELTCECRLCTAACETDEDCWNGMGIGAARCQAVESFGCEGGSAATRICVPDCADERCVSDEQASDGVGEETAVGVEPPELVSVPECPELSSPVSVAANFRTDLEQYAGPATVEASGAALIRLVPDAVAGELVELSSIPAELSELLAEGQRFDVEVDVTSGGDDYKALIVRSDGEVILAIYHGYDVWYQAGRFRDANHLRWHARSAHDAPE